MRSAMRMCGCAAVKAKTQKHIFQTTIFELSLMANARKSFGLFFFFSLFCMAFLCALVVSDSARCGSVCDCECTIRFRVFNLNALFCTLICIRRLLSFVCALYIWFVFLHFEKMLRTRNAKTNDVALWWWSAQLTMNGNWNGFIHKNY